MSRPSTRLPAVLTKAHTIAASSSAPCVSVPVPAAAAEPEDAGTSPVDAENVPAAAAVDNCESCCCCCCDLAVRSSEICPAVLRIAPDDRSSAMVAFTPGFLESRLRVSSSASAPLDCVAGGGQLGGAQGGGCRGAGARKVVGQAYRVRICHSRKAVFVKWAVDCSFRTVAQL